MSKFSEKCREYLEQSKDTVYNLSKKSGLERTKLLRMLNGKSLPADIETVKRFCCYVQITKREEDELLELYRIEKIGKEIYYGRKEVESLMSEIQKLRSEWKQMAHLRENMPQTKLNAKDTNIQYLRFDLDITEAIQYVIHKEIEENEIACIDMNMFPKCDYAMQQLIREEQMTKHTIICNHYINFVRGGGSIENIRMLRQIVPFAFTFRNRYQVGYSYVAEEHNEFNGRLWPYFLITSKCLLLFSESSNHGVLIENQAIVDCYREEINEISKSYRPLLEVSYLNTGEDLDIYFNKIIAPQDLRWVFEGHLCVARMYYPELLEVEKDNPYVTMLVGTHKEKIEHQVNCVFSVGDMQTFFKEGVLPGIYGKYSRPYTVGERKKMLEYYIENISKDYLKCYLLREDAMQIDAGISIELYEDNRLCFISTASEYPFGVVIVQESGICNTFRDYFENLKNSCVWNIEETKERLRELMNLFPEE